MTTKKTYKKPSLRVGMLQQSNLIATSGSPTSVSLRFNFEDDPEAEGYAD